MVICAFWSQIKTKYFAIAIRSEIRLFTEQNWTISWGCFASKMSLGSTQ